MSRSTWVLGSIAAAGLVASLWLYRENRELRGRLAATPAAAEASAAQAQRGATAAGPDDDGEPADRKRGSLRSFLRLGRDRTPPQLEPEQSETWAERRARRQQRLRAMLGRSADETPGEYRDRVAPLVTAGLARPRAYVDETRRTAEEAAGVTPEQRAQLDQVFDDAYAEALELTNAAVADGSLTPYERNVTGVLEVAGGLGAVLGTAEARYGEILSPEQRAAMRESGFDLGEYLGVSAPWEKLDPPPPPPGGDG